MRLRQIALIAADDRPQTCSGKEKLRAKCKPGGKLTAKIKKGTPGLRDLMKTLNIRGKAPLCKCGPEEQARPRYGE